MSALLYTLGVVAFVLAILVSIGLHEFGHLVPAKKFGCKVPQWFIGFGPTVWSKQIGDTEYGVKAIPLGGYVKIVGMLPPGARGPRRGDDVRRGRRGGPQGPPLQHGHVHPADLRRPRRGVGVRQAARHRPALLPPHVVEEGDRDGRRADGQHRHRLRPVRRCSSRPTATRATRSSSRSSPTCPRAWCPSRSRAAPAPPTTRPRPPRRPGSSPATRSSASTARPSATGTASSRRSAPTPTATPSSRCAAATSS